MIKQKNSFVLMDYLNTNGQIKMINIYYLWIQLNVLLVESKDNSAIAVKH